MIGSQIGRAGRGGASALSIPLRTGSTSGESKCLPIESSNDKAPRYATRSTSAADLANRYVAVSLQWLWLTAPGSRGRWPADHPAPTAGP